MKKILALMLAAVMLLAVAACTPTSTPDNTPAPTAKPADPTAAPAVTDAPPEVTPEPTPEPIVRPDAWERLEDEDVYEMVLARYAELMDAAHAEEDLDKKFVLYAEAEAELLGSGVMIPTTTQGGAYTISRIAYRTVPYVQWGNDDDRLHGLVISDSFITKEEREALKGLWAAAREAGEGYDPAAYLESQGHTIQDTYTLTFSTAPVTIDWLNTSSQSDTEITVNCVEGLVEYDNLGIMRPALAESWDVSEDGLTYTFHIRQGVKWFTSEGREYADVVANDFVAGFHHMLDTAAGLEWLVEGVVAGVSDYLYEGGSFDNVGYEAPDDYTLVITLEAPTSYFLTMLTYSCFLPICDSFYQAHGGVYGIDEYAAASQDTATYTYGMSTDPSSQVYCGPFLLQKLQKDSEILIVKNENYYKADEVTLNSVKWVVDDGSNPMAIYNDAVNGIFAGVSLGATNGLLEQAKADGYYDTCSYISDTTSTTYFGGLNLNRGTFALAGGACTSIKADDDEMKIDNQVAMLSRNFRLAVQFAFDKAAYNAVSRGEELALTSLRNMYTHPEFVFLENATTDDYGFEFAAGTAYGDMVQHYIDEMGLPIDVHDGVNGWYHPEEAVAYLQKAVEELGDAVNWPIHIDVVYLGTSETNYNQAMTYKESIEGVLGTDYVVVDLIEASTRDDFYACGYRASNGEAGNFDMFYGSGWGPDFGDPCTYLDTFLGMGAGYMTKVIGLF